MSITTIILLAVIWTLASVLFIIIEMIGSIWSRTSHIKQPASLIKKIFLFPANFIFSLLLK